jgi:hypothetical protein
MTIVPFQCSMAALIRLTNWPQLITSISTRLLLQKVFRKYCTAFTLYCIRTTHYVEYFQVVANDQNETIRTRLPQGVDMENADYGMGGKGFQRGCLIH